MKTQLLISMLFLSFSVSASSIYQCTDLSGKKTFSDKPCPSTAKESKTIVSKAYPQKEVLWEDEIKKHTPGKSWIMDIRKSGDDSVIYYNFYAPAELQEFMRSSVKLSGKNVNLLNVKMPKDGSHGEAKLQVTSKNTLPNLGSKK